MSSRTQIARRLLLSLVAAAVVLGAASAPAAAQPDNTVKIMIVANEIKVVNRGVGLCKTKDGDCENEVVWQWQGGQVPPGDPKIVISFIRGTEGAYDCFKGASGQPKLTFEILAQGDSATATVSADCPAKSAWLYQISCVRTDEGYEGQECEGIVPLDPGVVIG